MVFDHFGSPCHLSDDAVGLGVDEGDDSTPESCEECFGRELGEQQDVAVILLGYQLKYKARRDGEGEGIMPIDGDPPQLVTGAELGRQVLGPIEDHVVLGPGRAVSVSVSSCVSIAYHRVSVVLCDSQ